MIFFYNIFQIIIFPVFVLIFLFRIAVGKEDKQRLKERFGETNQQRDFSQKLIWIHCASVGESLSVLPMVKRLVRLKDTKVLLTTGTVTSAKLMAEKLPKGAIHQYVPIDYAIFVKRFIKNWQPDVSVFVESDLWPNLLHFAPNKILINARMSDKSFEKYSNNKLIAKTLLNGFKIIFAQSKQDFTRFSSLTSARVVNSGNIKNDGSALPFKKAEYDIIAQAFTGRKIIAAVSTHKTEEEKVLAIYKKVKEKDDSVMMILAPRHPHRGDDVAALIEKEGLSYIQRSKTKGLEKAADLDIYLADTLGELGLWFELTDFVVMGGSFLFECGGHNPLEPLKSGKITCCGPHMHNFKNMTDDLLDKKSIFTFEDENQIAEFIIKHLNNDKFKKDFAKLSVQSVAEMSGATDVVVKAISKAVKEGDFNA